jgi:hypothetical protein
MPCSEDEFSQLVLNAYFSIIKTTRLIHPVFSPPRAHKVVAATREANLLLNLVDVLDFLV